MEYKGSWAHWAFVKDVAKQEMSIYRNGALWHRAGGQARPLAEGGHANIGAYVNGSYKWSGRLAEFRIWDRPRTEEEVRADRGRRLTGKEPGLAGYWPLDRIDANGTTPDLSGHRPGVVRGATTALDEPLPAALAIAAPAEPVAAAAPPAAGPPPQPPSPPPPPPPPGRRRNPPAPPAAGPPPQPPAAATPPAAGPPPQPPAAGQRPLGVSPEAPEYVVAWAKMTSGIEDYARWQEMFEGRSGKDAPPFRRGRIWA